MSSCALLIGLECSRSDCSLPGKLPAAQQEPSPRSRAAASAHSCNGSRLGAAVRFWSSDICERPLTVRPCAGRRSQAPPSRGDAPRPLAETSAGIFSHSNAACVSVVPSSLLPFPTCCHYLNSAAVRCACDSSVCRLRLDARQLPATPRALREDYIWKTGEKKSRGWEGVGGRSCTSDTGAFNPPNQGRSFVVATGGCDPP